MAFTNYTIVPVDGVVVIDGNGYSDVDMTGIPETVHAIVWYGLSGTGQIQYKQLPDGTLPAPGSFTDPNDYSNQIEACENPQICYSTSNTSEYKGKTYPIGNQLIIREYPQPAVPLGFNPDAPPTQTLTYTYLFWTGSAFVWSLFDPNGTLASGQSTSTDWVNSEAYTILQPTDWYVVRQVENGTEIPANWNTWRQVIRQEANEKNTRIAACTTLQELLAYTTTTAFGTWTQPPA
jgi:hypothetical protein